MCRVSRVILAGVNQLQLLSLAVMSTTWSLRRHVVEPGLDVNYDAYCWCYYYCSYVALTLCIALLS